MTDQSTTAAPENLQTTETLNGQDPGTNDALDTVDTGSDLDPGASPAPGADNGSTDADLQAFREKLAGGDETILKQLARYRSIDAISKAYREAYNTAKNGKKLPAALTDKSTPEEVKAYREAFGIPDDAAAYPGDFREGYEASDFDREILADFKTAMFEKNVPPAFAEAALGWYQDFAVAQQQQLDANMAKTAKETQAALQAEWGGEYNGHIGAAQQIMTQHLGEEGFSDMMGLRLADGSRLQDHVGFVKMMAEIGTDYFGANAIMTGDVETMGKTLEARRAELMALKLTDPEKYKSDEVQREITQIYDRLDKNNKRRK